MPKNNEPTPKAAEDDPRNRRGQEGQDLNDTRRLRIGLGLLISIAAAALLILKVVDVELGVMIGMFGVFLGAGSTNATKRADGSHG